MKFIDVTAHLKSRTAIVASNKLYYLCYKFTTHLNCIDVANVCYRYKL